MKSSLHATWQSCVFGFGNLVPVFGFAMVGSWLIRDTGRFWPAFVIHAAYNAHLIFWRISLGLQ